MDGSGLPFPVKYKNLSLDIKLLPNCRSILRGDLLLQGNNTDIIISSYDDHFLVIATQIVTMGTIISARKEEELFSEPTFNVNVIFGKRDEPILATCARQLIEHISNSGSSRPLILSLGLKDHSMTTLKEIVSAIIENRLW